MEGRIKCDDAGKALGREKTYGNISKWCLVLFINPLPFICFQVVSQLYLNFGSCREGELKRSFKAEQQNQQFYTNLTNTI